MDEQQAAALLNERIDLVTGAIAALGPDATIGEVHEALACAVRVHLDEALVRADLTAR